MLNLIISLLVDYMMKRSALLSLTRTPSLGEKIQHGCLICVGSEQPSCFSCLIILDTTFKNLGPQHTIFDQVLKQMLNFIIFPNFMGFERGT